MNQQEFKIKFFKDLGSLALTLGEQVTKERLQAYFDILADDGRQPEDILAAIRQAVKVCKFFPKPAELIELMTGGKGGGKDPAVAWQEVLKAMEDIGPYGNAKFSDGAIGAAVIALGGWPSLCGLSYKELTLQCIPAKFAALYAEAVRHGRHRSPGTVTGIIDRDNAARGYELESPAIKAKTMDEIMAQTEKPALPEPERRARIKLLPGPEETEALKAKDVAAMAALAEKMRLEPVPDSVREMREQEASRKELKRIGGGKAYFEIAPEPRTRRGKS